MNNDNIIDLLESLKAIGFDNKYITAEQLERQMVKDCSEFQLNTDIPFDEPPFNEKQELEFVLHFARSKKTNMYFFEKYAAKLDGGKGPEKGEAQTFHINKGKEITLKDAHHLLQGRCIFKFLTSAEGEQYNAWLQLNFREKDKDNNYKLMEYRETFGFDLEKALQLYPIQELQSEDLEKELIKNLKNGKACIVLFQTKKKSVKMLVETNVGRKTLKLHPVRSTSPSSPKKSEDK